MYPTICYIGPVAIYSYGVMVAVAALVCSFLMVRDGRSLGITSEEIYDLVFWAAVGGIVGARIFYILLNLPFFLADPLEMVMLHHGGLAWQGGLVFGSLAVGVVIKKSQRPFFVMADFIAPYLALGHAIGRIGCFLNGCCYGKEASWGIYFPVHDAHLHPTQLYECAALIGLFFVLKILRQRWEKQPGLVFVGYLTLSALIRFIIEFFRADHQPLLLNLSVFQYVSVFFFVLGLGIFFVVRRKNA